MHYKTRFTINLDQFPKHEGYLYRDLLLPYIPKAAGCVWDSKTLWKANVAGISYDLAKDLFTVQTTQYSIIDAKGNFNVEQALERGWKHSKAVDLDAPFEPDNAPDFKEMLKGHKDVFIAVGKADKDYIKELEAELDKLTKRKAERDQLMVAKNERIELLESLLAADNGAERHMQLITALENANKMRVQQANEQREVIVDKDDELARLKLKHERYIFHAQATVKEKNEEISGLYETIESLRVGKKDLERDVKDKNILIGELTLRVENMEDEAREMGERMGD